MRVTSKIFYWYVVFLVVFIALSLVPSPDAAALIKYHLTSLQLRSLQLTLIIPEAAIWYAAFYGYHKLQLYSQTIRAGAEGRQISKLAHGLLLLALSLPVNAILSTVLALIASHHHTLQALSVIIKNYADVILPLLAFLYISTGARGLSDLRKIRPRLQVLNAVIFAVISLGVVFCSLIVLDHKELRTTYHMSPELVMITLGIPYIYTWFLGLLASVELQEYSRKVAGIVYRKSWRLFIGGLLAVISLSILLQYLSTLSTWLTSLSLQWILLLLYVLLLLLASAFIIMALGAKQLMKIEEA